MVFDVIDKLHPATVHFPLGGLFVLFTAEVAAFLEVQGFRRTWIAWTFMVLTCIPAATTGYLRSEALESGPLADALIHGRFMLGALGVTLLAGTVQLRWGRSSLTIMLLWVALVTMLYGAYLGTLMVHGL